jgi:hypothetical protein
MHQEPLLGSYDYSLPLLGPEDWKRERTASGVRRKQSIGESRRDVNSRQKLAREIPNHGLSCTFIEISLACDDGAPGDVSRKTK